MYHINKEITRNGENLTLKNTAKHYYKKFDILGASKQETRSGKNLCKLDDKTETSNGITSVITNGVVSVKGTATSTWFNLTTNQSFTLKAGTYTVSVNKTLTQFGIDFYDSSATVFSLAKNLTSAKFTLSSEKTITRFVGVVANGEVLNIDGLTFQIEEGSVVTEHEQYGASPSIEYESPIESVGDNINLLNIEDSTNTTGGVTRTIKSGEITLNGTPNDLYYNLVIGTYTAQKTGIYTLMPFKSSTNTNIRLLYQLNGGSFVSNDLSMQIEMNKSDVLTLNLRIDSTSSITNFTLKPKLVLGTSAGAYSPYGQGSIEIYNCNDNVWKQYEKGYISNTDGSITPSSTFASNYIPIPNGESNVYYYASNLSSSLNNIYACRIGFYDTNKDWIKNETVSTPTVLSIPDNAKYIRASFSEYAEDTMIYWGGKVDYIEHQSQTKALYTQQLFRAIGDVKDRFVRVNGANKEQHSIARKIFNGTENWGIARTTDNITIYQCLLNDSNYDDLSKNLLSNMFESYTPSELWYSTTNGIAINSYKYVQIAITSIINSIDNFKSWLAEQYANGTPLYVDYVLAKPTLIECTPEQVEQLEEIEKEMYSYDEVTNIYSTDKISPYFDVIAYQRISEEFKTRLKEGKITRGYLKVLATDTLPEIIIDENNYLKDLKIEELRYVPEEGFIGGAVAKRVSGNFNNVDNSFDIQDREVEVYLGVELEDETTEYIKYGTYIVQRPEDDQVNDNTSFEALDYMVKFNQEYKDRITYPCTLKELLNDVLDQAGVNSKTNTFANSDFIVENNQFEQGTTLRDVIKAIAQVAFNWARIDEDDNFVMDFEMNENIDEELGTDDYFGFKKTDNYGPVNVIVLRNSQVEGENITIKDENLINSPKGYNLLNMKNAKGGTHTGITCTTNEDGTYNYVGTAGSTTINVWLLGGYQVQAPILITLEPRKILHARL